MTGPVPGVSGAEAGRRDRFEVEAGTGTGTRFEVWRQDDNGNRYLISTHAERAAAEAVVAEMESGVQHKQLYFVVERPADGPVLNIADQPT